LGRVLPDRSSLGVVGGAQNLGSCPSLDTNEAEANGGEVGMSSSPLENTHGAATRIAPSY
jgi:hypothetical protein